MYSLLGFDKIAEQLIQKGADVNHVINSNNNTALINAAYKGCLHNIFALKPPTMGWGNNFSAYLHENYPLFCLFTHRT